MARRKPTTTAPAPEPTPAAPAQTEANVDQEIAVLRGRLTRDPELRHTAGGKAVTTIRIAVNHDDGATFHNVVCWERTAVTVCKYMKKGRLVEATGRLRPRTWTGQDGQERTEVELSAYRVQFIRMQPAAPAADAEAA